MKNQRIIFFRFRLFSGLDFTDTSLINNFMILSLMADNFNNQRPLPIKRPRNRIIILMKVTSEILKQYLDHLT